MMGSQATGKSTLARALAERLPAIVLDKDEFRIALFPPSEIDYSFEQNALLIRVMLMVAEYILKKDSSKHIILDGKPFSKRCQREAALSVARGVGVPFKIIKCECADEIARTRLEQDLRERRHIAAVDRSYDKYLAIKESFDEIRMPHIVVDTGQSLESVIERCLVCLESDE